MVDDETGVLQLGGVIGLRPDAVGLLHKDAVAAVGAAAHDEVGGHGALSVGGLTQDDAPAGIGIGGQLFPKQAGFIDVHA